MGLGCFGMAFGWCWDGFGMLLCMPVGVSGLFFDCFCGSRSLVGEKVEEQEPLGARERTTGRAVWVVVCVCFWLVCWIAWGWFRIGAVLFLGFVDGFEVVFGVVSGCVLDGFGMDLGWLWGVFGLVLIVFWVPGAQWLRRLRSKSPWGLERGPLGELFGLWWLCFGLVCWIALGWFRIVVGWCLFGLWMVLNGLGMFYVVWECVLQAFGMVFECVSGVFDVFWWL